ncbi:MAG: aldehyde dehydrogenase family protein [Nitrospirales bacterium]|nr:aldehyde dehydrogenase family protein [Nitrospirales bacterium]
MNKLHVVSPFDGHVISELEFTHETEIEDTLNTAERVAHSHDAMIPPFERTAILERTANLVEAKAHVFAKQAAEEGGKPLTDSKVELERAIQGIREAARSINQLVGREIPMKLNGPSNNRMAFTIREPIGPVVAISAFNHPFNLIVHQVIPAIAVGCPVIVKPALTTPLSCFNLVQCLLEAGLPNDWCKVVICDNDLAERIVTDPRVGLFSFIGSAKVGWALRSKLAPGVRCTLEHGGAAPVLIDSTADIQDALPLLAKGGYYHAGQVCVSVQRVFAHESIANDVVRELADLAKQMVVGNPENEATDVGPLILEREVNRVAQWVDEAQKLGGTIQAGGAKINNTCYAPTVILNPPHTAKVSTEEIFGPVINVYTYTDRLDAIERANHIPFSFQAAVFTKDIDVALDTVKRLNAAAVMINDHTAFRVDWMPFAGRKSSGLGVGGILPTMLEMTEEKMIVFRSALI